MNIQIGYFTDKGIRKAIDEDSFVIRTASTAVGPMVMAAVCDGMGGLNRGELASSELVQCLSEWFDETLPVLLSDGLDIDTLRAGIEYELRRQNDRFEAYASRRGFRMGTTAAILLLYCGWAITINVGDSRIYAATNRLVQLTKDQSFVQSEVDAGRLTPEAAAVDPRRNLLLQCIGQSALVTPDILCYPWESGTTYLLCSDGFHHELRPDEICGCIAAAAGQGNEAMSAQLARLGQMVMARGEIDNITALTVNIG